MSRKPSKAGNGEGHLFRKSDKNGREYGSWISLFRTPDGRQHPVNHRTKDYDQAKKLHAQLTAQYLNEDTAFLSEKVTVSEYIENWWANRRAAALTKGDDELKPASVKRYGNLIGLTLRFLKETGRNFKLLRDFTTEDLKAYRIWRLQQTRFNGQSDVPITRQGVNRDVKFLRGIFVRAFRERLLPRDITLDLKPLKVIKRKIPLPTLAGIREVLAVIEDPEVRDLVTADVLTGARSAELFHLDWGSVNFETAFLYIQPREEDGGDDADWDPKNADSVREVPIAGELMAILKRIRRERPGARNTDPVFLMPDGRPFYEYPNFAYRKLKKAINKANRLRRKESRGLIPMFNLRLLRHFFISWSLTRRDHPLSELELIHIVGHVDLAMFRKTYFHADLEGETGRRMRAATIYDPPAANVNADDEDEGETDSEDEDPIEPMGYRIADIS